MKVATFYLRSTGLVLLIFFGIQLSGQAPHSFNYQGVARNGDGEALQNRTVNLRISLLQNTANGILQFQEEQSTTTSDRGLFSIRIGEGSSIIGSLQSIDWAIDKYFLKVEMDPSGGQNFIDIGNSQLYSVPYALYALNSGSSGQGGANQNLTLNGSVLSIEGGNSIDLGVLQDGVDDADADPGNELQSLSIRDNILTISGGNSVNLPSSTGGNGNSSSLWRADDGDVIYEGGGDVIYRKNNQDQLVLSSNDNGGYWDLFDENGQFSAWAFTFEDGAGFLGTLGPNGNTNIRMTVSAERPNSGFFGIANEEGESKVGSYVSQSGTGSLFTEGPNGNLNTFITSLSDEPNNGFIAVYDENENNKAGIYVDENGQGRIYADFVDNFVINPEKTNERIVYTMLQGPESASYLRGTATMIEGTGTIEFPRHFSNQISPDNMTVMITPLSEHSKGIAVIKKSTTGFKVKELLQGKGNYSFDWEVKAIRKIRSQKSSVLPQISSNAIEERAAELNGESIGKNHSKKSQ